ncbi:MAG: VOC family protein [Candidatus Limnocylindrales bacterium]
MFLGIDHLVIAVPDPDVAAGQLERELGLAATGGGRHVGEGTFNRLVWLGDTYLELIGVFDRALAARSWIGAPALAALARGGGLATWAIASDALEQDLDTLRVAGSEFGEPIAGQRRRDDGALVRWRVATPRLLGPSEPPFLIEHDPTAAEWLPADRDARLALVHPLGGQVRLEVLELLVDDVNQTLQRFLRTTGLRFRPSLAGGGGRDATIGAQIVRLRPRRPGSVSAVMRLAAPVPAGRMVELLGCRWVVRPARPAEGLSSPGG